MRAERLISTATACSWHTEVSQNIDMTTLTGKWTAMPQHFVYYHSQSCCHALFCSAETVGIKSEICEVYTVHSCWTIAPAITFILCTKSVATTDALLHSDMPAGMSEGSFFRMLRGSCPKFGKAQSSCGHGWTANMDSSDFIFCSELCRPAFPLLH